MTDIKIATNLYKKVVIIMIVIKWFRSNGWGGDSSIAIGLVRLRLSHPFDKWAAQSTCFCKKTSDNLMKEHKCIS